MASSSLVGNRRKGYGPSKRREICRLFEGSIEWSIQRSSGKSASPEHWLPLGMRECTSGPRALQASRPTLGSGGLARVPLRRRCSDCGGFIVWMFRRWELSGVERLPGEGSAVFFSGSSWCPTLCYRAGANHHNSLTGIQSQHAKGSQDL